MMPLVFLQVLEQLGLVSEQENSGPEELEANPPTNNTTVLTIQPEINSSPLSSHSFLSNKDVSFTAPVTGTEDVFVPRSVVASSSLSDAESVLPPTSPLSGCTSGSVSVPALSNSPSNSHSEALSVGDDSCIPPQTRSAPPDSHLIVDGIAAYLSEIPSEESNCAQIEDSPLKIVIGHSSSQKHEVCSLQAQNSPSDTLI